MFEPSYLKLQEEGALKKRIDKVLTLLESCSLCPRLCGVNRLKGELGICNTGRKAGVASFSTHFGEELPLVGRHGSGTIFISSCNLLCSYCQNYEISHIRGVPEVDPEGMAAMMMQLAERGCHNINFVSPTHVIPQLLEALQLTVKKGFRLPLVYNSGGYDREETIGLLDGIFDIYMPDFKFWEEEWAEKYCDVKNYTKIAMSAIKEMYRQVGDLTMDDQGIAFRGLLIRHLVMPRDVAGTSRIMKFISKEISRKTYVNVMDQYRPCGGALNDELINRPLTTQEFKEAMTMAVDAGLTRLDPGGTPD